MRPPESSLRADLLADLRVDLACSLRDNPDTPEWIAYRASLRALIAAQEARDSVLTDAELRDGLHARDVQELSLGSLGGGR